MKKKLKEKSAKRKRTKTLAERKAKVDITRKPKNIHKPVTIGGDKKPWYWCSPETGGKCPGLLRRHKPSECEGKAGKTSKPIPKKLRLEAAEAVMAGDLSQKELEDNLAEIDLSSIDSDGWERKEVDLNEK